MFLTMKMMFPITITPYLINRYCSKNNRKYLKIYKIVQSFRMQQPNSYGEYKQTKSYLP